MKNIQNKTERHILLTARAQTNRHKNNHRKTTNLKRIIFNILTPAHPKIHHSINSHTQWRHQHKHHDLPRRIITVMMMMMTTTPKLLVMKNKKKQTGTGSNYAYACSCSCSFSKSYTYVCILPTRLTGLLSLKTSKTLTLFITTTATIIISENCYAFKSNNDAASVL